MSKDISINGTFIKKEQWDKDIVLAPIGSEIKFSFDFPNAKDYIDKKDNEMLRRYDCFNSLMWVLLRFNTTVGGINSKFDKNSTYLTNDVNIASKPQRGIKQQV